MSESKCKIDGSKLYYFLNERDGRYHTMFVGFIRPEMVQKLTELEEGGQAYFRITIGEHKFASYSDGPVYALEYGKNGAMEFAGDDGKLTFFPNGAPEDFDLPPVIDFPTCWTAGVAPLLDFKLGGGIYAKEGGQWVALTL